jgi:Sugar (and other) transporter
VSPPKLRGRLVVNWQVFDAFGIAFAFTLNLIFARDSYIGWRLMFASGLLPTLPMLALVFAVPESPRFLMKRGLYAEAYRSLLRLRGHPIRAAKEMIYLDAQLEAAEAQLMSWTRTTNADEEVHRPSTFSEKSPATDDDEDYDDIFDVETQHQVSDPDDDAPDTDPSGFWERLKAWGTRMWKGGEPANGQTDPFVELFRETTYLSRVMNLVSHPRVARACESAGLERATC